MVAAPRLVKQDQRIILKNLRANCFIGVWEHEQQNRQPLILDVVVAYKDRHAAQSDQLSDTLNYSQLTKDILTFVEKTHFQLLEALSYHLAEFIFHHFPVHELILTINKPNALKSLGDISHQAHYKT